MKILWICGLPKAVREAEPQFANYHAHSDWSWILGHLPPPPNVELHIAFPVTSGPWAPTPRSYQGVQFHPVRCLPGRLQTGYLLDPLYYRNLYRRLRPAVVHGWGTEDAFGIVAQSLAPKHCVVQVQGLFNAYLPYLQAGPGTRYAAWRERNTLAHARTVFVESQFSASITQPLCGPQTCIHLVDHPLRREFLHAPPSPGTAQRVLYLGSLCDRKGYRDAVQAFIDSAPSDWSLLMIGSGTSGASARLSQMIAQAGEAHRIRHVAEVNPASIVQHMRESSIFLLPSRMDTGPTALKEALAMGLWPICYDNSGPGEYIRRFNYGSLAPTGDTTALARQLSMAIAHRPWTANLKNSIASSEVRTALAAEAIWPRLTELYQGINP